ncbi:MAG: response regulator transcription factor [Lachnospiraceae bacterium]|nr:response regulator transcription factor [Lachnospiraceae bacterium]
MRLLLAEDEEDMSNALVKILKSNNYSVDAVYNGNDALDYLMSDIYDGAILDIMMPGMSGIDALKEARANGIKTPVLLLTAKSEVDDRVEGLDSGADDYLTKPFAMKELLARVRALTRRREEVVDSLLEYGNVSLDRLTYQLSTPKGGVKLGNKDFQMLEMLITNPGQIISVDQFMDKIWGYDSDAELNVVWVYISNLRKKLKSLEADITIKAHRGIGYSLTKNVK